MADLIAALAATAGGVAVESDDDFANTVLLLHGDGTDGTQNNTFLDSSTNNFTITRNGNCSMGSFSPFSKPDSRWGNYFDGSYDNIKIASNAAFAIGAGNFTVEMFASFNAWSGTNQRIFMQDVSGTSNLQIGRDSGANNLFVVIAGSTVISYAWTPNVGQFYHIAVVRSGTGSNQVALYIDGVSVATGTSAGSIGQQQVIIGGLDWAANYSMQGYLSNVRYSDVARSISVPTAPYSSDADTLILTCQSNRFKDNSSNAFAVTAGYDAKVTPFSPFPITTEYSPSVNGGSGYFDGSGDFLTVPSDVDFEFGSGDFTMELSLYAANISFGNRTFLQYGLATVTGWAELSWGFGTDASGNPFFEVSNGVNAPQFTLTSSTALKAFSWNHIAIVRDGNDFTLYLNGTSVGTTNSSFSLYNPGASSLFHIGRAHNAATSRDWPGYISSLRVVKGTAITPSAGGPTSPPTAVSGTSLLCNFTNAGIYDNTGFNNLETVGNAQIDTTTKKYGTGAMEFDGNGDYLEKPVDPLYAFGTGDFTIECWYWKSANGVNGYDGIISTATDGNGSNGYYVELNTTRGFYFRIGSTNYANTTTTWINDSTWHHFALSRSGTSLRYFIDGDLKSTFTSSDQINAGGAVRIGAIPNASNVPTYFFNGYIDDLRISRVARYTTTFTPPTKAFPNVGA